MDGTPCCPEYRTCMSLSLNDIRHEVPSWRSSVTTNILGGHELHEIVSTVQCMGRCCSMGFCCCCTYVQVPLIACRRVQSCRSSFEQCLLAQSMSAFTCGDDKGLGKDGLSQSRRGSKIDGSKGDEDGAEGGGKRKMGGAGGSDEMERSGKLGSKRRKDSKKGKGGADESDSDEGGKGRKGAKQKTSVRRAGRSVDDDDEGGGKKGRKSKQDAKGKKRSGGSDIEGKIKKDKASKLMAKDKGRKARTGSQGSDAISGKRGKGKKEKGGKDQGGKEKGKATKKSKASRRGGGGVGGGRGGRGARGGRGGRGGRRRRGKGSGEGSSEWSGEGSDRRSGDSDESYMGLGKEERAQKEKAVKCHMIIEANRIKRVQLLKATGSRSLSDLIERKMKEKEKQLKDEPYDQVGRMYDSNCSSVTSLTKSKIGVVYDHGCIDPVKALKLFSFDEQLISNERFYNIRQKTGKACPRNDCYLCNL